MERQPLTDKEMVLMLIAENIELRAKHDDLLEKKRAVLAEIAVLKKRKRQLLAELNNN